MKYGFTLTDDTTTADFTSNEPSFTTTPVNADVIVTTLDNNTSRYIFPEKRLWGFTFSYMSTEQYEVLRGFYVRQRTNYRNPLLSIPDDGINNVVVDMVLNEKNIIDNCGTIEGVNVIFREITQIPEGS